MSDLKQVGYIDKNMQGNRVYDADGISATLASQTGGLGGTGAGVYLIDENKAKGCGKLTQLNEIIEGTPFNYVSLFSGIGGFEQALNKLGGTCVMASEIDKYANQAYEVLYGHPTVGDVTKVEAKDVPDHDLLVGGFPCQAFSVAGKRLGFDDTRGTLFFEIARIAAEKKPKAVLLENVKGIIGHDGGKTLDTIVQTLCDIGYTVDFEVLNSKYFGVPQNRERIFIVAIRDDLVYSTPWVIGRRTDVVAKGKRRIGALAGVKTFNFDWPEQGEVTTRLRDILETDVDERYYLSEEKTAKLVSQLEDKDKVVGTVGHHPFSKKLEFKGYNSEISPCLVATDYKAPKTTLEAAEESPQILGHIDLKGHDAIRRVYSTTVVSPTLTTMGGGHRGPKIAIESSYHFPTPDGINNTLRTGGKGSLSAKHNCEHIAEPVEVKSVGNVNPSGNGMNGKVYDIDAGLSPTLTTNKGEGVKIAISEYKELCPKCMVIEHIGLGCDCDTEEEEEVRPVLTPDRLEKRQNGRRFKDDGEESFTLTAQDRHGDAVSSGVPPRYRIRKLSPLECFRLQGFPDDAHQALVDAGISNSQRYKMAGNAVTVNVIDAIARKLIPTITLEVDVVVHGER